MIAPPRLLICLLMLAAANPAVGDGGPHAPARRAVGPTGMRPAARHAIAMRPEDAPPRLPASLPNLIDHRVGQRVDNQVQPATFSSAALTNAAAEPPPTTKLSSNSTETGSRVEPISPAFAVSAPTNAAPGSEGDAKLAGKLNDDKRAVDDRATGERADDTRRVLAAPTKPREALTSGEAPALADFSWLPKPSSSLSTTTAAVALVSGLLLLTFAVMKRAMPRSARPLPQDVVSILGRVPMANKQTAQLMKIGGKLVLVGVTSDGAKPLTEITDPEEVARLIGRIEQASPHSASAAFQEVFAEVAKQPAASGFLGADGPTFAPSPMIDRGQLAAAYANTPGGRANG